MEIYGWYGRRWRVESIICCCTANPLLAFDPPGSLICGAHLLEMSAALGFLKRLQIAMRQGGMLSPGIGHEADLNSDFDCRTWRIESEAPTAQVYGREKDASMTRELQFCNLMSAVECAGSTVPRLDFTSFRCPATTSDILSPRIRQIADVAHFEIPRKTRSGFDATLTKA